MDTLRTRRTLPFALLPLLASGLAAAAPVRVGAMVIPMDQGAEATSVEVESYVNDALEVYPNYELKKMDDLLGTPPDEGAAAAMRRFQQGYEESKVAFDAGKLDDAERKLRSTLKEYKRAAAAMNKCVQLCDALAMYASVLFSRGDIEEARNQILDLTSLNPTFELSPRRYKPNFLALRSIVAGSKAANMKGTLLVKSRPAGTRVYLDGDFQGHTPVTIAAANAGKHILRFERPGFVQSAQVVEILPEETEATADLIPTPAFRNFDALANKLATEVVKSTGASSTVSTLGNKFGIDRAVVVVARELGESETTELSLALFDIRRGQKLATKRVSFQGDEFGQLKGEISRVVTALVNSVENPTEKGPKSSDPLENKAGIEDWSGDDKGGKSGREERKKKKDPKDPLDDRSGMEDW